MCFRNSRAYCFVFMSPSVISVTKRGQKSHAYQIFERDQRKKDIFNNSVNKTSNSTNKLKNRTETRKQFLIRGESNYIIAFLQYLWSDFIFSKSTTNEDPLFIVYAIGFQTGRRELFLGEARVLATT